MITRILIDISLLCNNVGTCMDEKKCEYPCTLAMAVARTIAHERMCTIFVFNLHTKPYRSKVWCYRPFGQ